MSQKSKPKTKVKNESSEPYIEKWMQEEKSLSRGMAIFLGMGALFSIIQSQSSFGESTSMIINVVLIIIAAWLYQSSTDDEKIHAKILRSLKIKAWLMALMGIIGIIIMAIILISRVSPDYYLIQIYLLIWSGFKSLWDAKKIAAYEG